MTTNFFGRRELGQLTDEERQRHYENVCEAAGLNPDLNLLRYRNMDDGSGSGQKHLILYATKGATNAIRGVQGIDVVEQTDAMIGTLYVVTTKVKNAAGRTDIAKGAFDMEGKRGKAAENGIALAQTRSTRRATLQISGLDLLDESELEGESTNPVSDAPTPLPPVKQPAQKASSAIGKDITAPAGLTLKAPKLALSEEVSAASIDPPLSEGEERRLKNPAAGLKIASDNLAGPGLNRAGRVIEKPAVPQLPATKTEFHVALPEHAGTNVVVFPPDSIPAEDVTVSVAGQHVAAEDAAPGTDPALVDPPKKPRKKRTPKPAAEVAPVVIPTEQAGLPPGGDYVNLSSQLIEEPVKPVDKIDAILSAPLARAVAAPGAKATTTTLNLPNSEQMKSYVSRLSDLRERILPEGGLIQSHGMGPNAKIRKFFSVVNNNTEDLGKLTVAQWETTFAYIDEILKQKNPKALVDSINYNIGAVDEPTA